MATIDVPKQTNLLSAKYISIGIFLIILIAVFISLYLTRIKFVLRADIIIPTRTDIINPKPQTILQISKMKCIIPIDNNGGRLGNLMFLLASAYGLARLHFCHLYLTPKLTDQLKSIFVLDLSPLLISSSIYNSTVDNSSHPMNKTSWGAGCEYVIALTRPNAIREGTIFELRGYWQSYLHFAEYRDELRQQIFVASQPVFKKVSNFFIRLYIRKLRSAPPLLSTDHQSFKKELAQSNRVTWIGIHVRRSDFVDLGYSSSDDYVFAAIKNYTVRYPNAHFIVASDEKPYCEKLFHGRSNIIVTPRWFSIGDDLITLSLCQHSIVTGGTYGWWTGYLANGEVIHDRVYPSGCEKREYYYPPWYWTNGTVRAHRTSDYVL